MTGTKREQICSCFVLIAPTLFYIRGALNLNYPPHKKICTPPPPCKNYKNSQGMKKNI